MKKVFVCFLIGGLIILYGLFLNLLIILGVCRLGCLFIFCSVDWVVYVCIDDDSFYVLILG
jgi:hypothetical protein